jgi:hypothetical protein
VLEEALCKRKVCLRVRNAVLLLLMFVIAEKLEEARSIEPNIDQIVDPRNFKRHVLDLCGELEALVAENRRKDAFAT